MPRWPALHSPTYYEFLKEQTSACTQKPHKPTKCPRNPTLSKTRNARRRPTIPSSSSITSHHHCDHPSHPRDRSHTITNPRPRPPTHITQTQSRLATTNRPNHRPTPGLHVPQQSLPPLNPPSSPCCPRFSIATPNNRATVRLSTVQPRGDQFGCACDTDETKLRQTKWPRAPVKPWIARRPRPTQFHDDESSGHVARCS